jgi:hypothetical protein
MAKARRFEDRSIFYSSNSSIRNKQQMQNNL